MDNATLLTAPDYTRGRTFGLRVASVVAALALVFAMVVLLQQRADAAPSAGAAAVAGATVGVADGSAQVNFSQIVCPILLSIRAAFANSPFFSFIQPIIDQLLAQFGCVISPAA